MNESDVTGTESVGETAAGERYPLPALQSPVEILVDRWGIPHIYAESSHDAYVAQGFNAARDRLVQLDLWRRKRLGRMAAAFGPAHVAGDRAARLLLYRGDIEEEWQAYPESARDAITGFVAGINAYLDWLDAHPERLPREFRDGGVRPERWAPEDVVRPRTHAPCFNVLAEFYRARIAAATGDPDLDRVRQWLARGHRVRMRDGLDSAALDLPADVLADYLAATGRPPPYGPGGSVGTTPDMADAGGAGRDGSNAWALAPHRTTSGRPILASDPHRPYAAPSLRYIAHLSAPGLDVIGAGEPQMPGVALGHNGTAAFAFTVHTIDSEDLVLCGRDEISRVHETIEVAGEEPRSVELGFAPDGPVLYEDVGRDRACALRSTWFEPGTAPYMGSLRVMRATSWDEFSAAADGWRYPGENLVYADVSGTIGLRPAGLVPRRRGYDGLLPVPSERYASDRNLHGRDASGRRVADGDGPDCRIWDGFLGSETFFRTVNPPEGFVATANEDNVPDAFPLPAYDWPDDVRRRRIVQALSAAERHSLGDTTALQTDVVSLSAREVLRALRTLWRSRGSENAGASARGELAGDVSVAVGARAEAAPPALDLLLGWDGEESADSAAAAYFETWWSRHLGPAVIRSLAPGAGRLIPTPDPRVARDWVRRQAEAGDPGGVLAETLAAAYAEVRVRLGDDPTAWRWGDLHAAVQRHPWRAVDPASARSLDVGRAPVGGSASTVSATAYLPYDFTPSNGPSFRMVLDVGAWDNSVCVNTPGQSGDPDSPHYRDMFDRWRHGEYVPMLYSRDAVEAYVERRILLHP